jgi:tetratricopeptide (TPR) repeat protein
MLKLAHVPDHYRTPKAARAVRSATPRLQHLYYAFLSYSHKDQTMADWLHRELERFRVPRSLAGQLTANGIIPKKLTPIFRDRHELAAADDLGEEIREALAASRYLIVLCSPDAARSRWVNAEIETFKRTRPDGCVLAAIVAGDPFASDVPGREQEECFPPALRERYDRRGRPTGKRAEPLAADMREKGDGKRAGFLKLVAGMLEVGLDDLVQRDTTRRHRRLAYLAAASLAGMAVTSGLAVAAIQARDSARDQRREAEGLVAFMLGDLKDKLEPIGRLDALDGVGSRVLAYYSKQDASELSDAALLQRARALSLTAQVAYLRGDYDGAARLYREAMAGTEEAIRRSPDDPQRLFDHAQNVFWVGDLARRRGQIGQAEAAFREYGRLAAAMVAIEPDNLKWRMEVQYARENLGTVLMSQRRFAEATRQFESALGPMQSVAAIDPGSKSHQLAVSNVFAWLADAQRALGRFDAAISLRERQVSLLERLSTRGATDVTVRDDLIPAHRAIGGLWTFRGDFERGIAHYRMGLAEANRLIAIEPNNSMWKDGAASIRLDLALNLLAIGRREEAVHQATVGCDAVTALRARDHSVVRWRRLETTCMSTKSRLALASGDEGQALTYAVRALASARAQRSDDPIEDRYNVAAAHRMVGDVRARLGDSEGARSAWSAGLAQLPSKTTERPHEMSVRADLLRLAGRGQEARPLIERLQAIGYKRMA